MKKVWVKIVPWDKPLAIAALEGGADAVVLSAGDAPRMRELGRMTVVAPDGDLRPGRDLTEMEIRSKADERAAAAAPGNRTLLLRMSDWTVIPLENLIAQRGNILVEATSAESARTAAGILEKGVDGVVLATRDPEEIRKTVRLVREFGESLALGNADAFDRRLIVVGSQVARDRLRSNLLGEKTQP